ncbi:HesA/MoeB/ThiF family protein [Arthrobacter sp. FW306-2-2C-D06B]|uniref:HesA/MoeB/ThiF family protein n=1 Tax=Arthrobacter sp. FW306-2-2C-D06B TaxID=2879618 RepID=UPI001F18AF5A|nr:ThiF family adenylyltransferase [Arthrobacter sp. FW306-2-2C-D06B]UKA57632.1 ThiF family adenylyltransferase [Arthrobacter sp. FW306-2-2C-D06B]
MQFICTMELRVLEFDVSPFVIELIPLLDGLNSIERIESILEGSAGFSRKSLENVLAIMETERLFDRYPQPEYLNANRFERQERLFQEFASTFSLASSPTQLQERLRTSKVVVVGVGGTGTWLLQSLVAAGIGRIEIFDPDIVELTNLNRQILFQPGDLGLAKVDVSAERFTSIDENLQVTANRHRVVAAADLESALRDASLVVGCADEPDVVVISDIIAEAAMEARVPHIVGGAYGGNLGVPGTSIIPGQTVCWQCIRAQTMNDHSRSNFLPLKGRTRSGGSTAAISGLVANLAAWEAMRILLGLPLALSGQVRELELFTLDWRVRKLAGLPDCRCEAQQ